MATCKSCGAKIVWVELVSGKTMPLNAEKTTIFRRIDGGGFWGPFTGHMTHFATCPDAAHHRKPKGE